MILCDKCNLVTDTQEIRISVDTLRLRQNGRHVADDTFKGSFSIRLLAFWFWCHWSLFLRVQITDSTDHTNPDKPWEKVPLKIHTHVHVKANLALC